MSINLDNFKMLLAEVSQQMVMVENYLNQPSAKIRETIAHKVAYISTLATMIQNESFDKAANRGFVAHKGRLLRAVASISSRLDRISDLAYNLVRQTDHLSSPDFLHAYNLRDFFENINFSLGLVGSALEENTLELALKICRSEESLDAHYANRFARLIEELNLREKTPGDLVTTLMVVHYLERIGDVILEIGEYIMYVILGEDLKYQQFKALAGGLKAAGWDGAINPGDFQSIWSGRSGCRIGVVAGGSANNDDPLIFKHGPASKVLKEKDSLELWSRLRPGLTPKVTAFLPGMARDEAGLLLEFIPDNTLRDYFMSASEEPAISGLTGVLKIMEGVWQETMEQTEAHAGFMAQAEKRLSGVESLHARLVNFKGRLGPLKIYSMTELLKLAKPLEEKLAAPFSVRIHGDFNLSNILYDPEQNLFHFLDLHRSRMSDYIQDLSVMILSILRLPLKNSRVHLVRAALLVYEFTKSFAARYQDLTAEARLSFGLARSFLTSARFELKESTARHFIATSRYLLESLINHKQNSRDFTDFQLSTDVLHC